MLVCMMAASVSGFAPRAPLSVTRFAKTNDGAQSVRMMARKADAAASKFWEGDVRSCAAHAMGLATVCGVGNERGGRRSGPKDN